MVNVDIVRMYIACKLIGVCPGETLWFLAVDKFGTERLGSKYVVVL